DAVTEASCLAALASTLARLGEFGLAAARLRETLAVVTRLDAPRESVAALESMAEWLMATGHPADSARMLAAAGSARNTLASPRLPLQAKEVARLSERVTGSLGPEERARQDALGAGLQLADALAEATALANRVQ